MYGYTPEEIINLRPLVFLCGPFYDSKDRRDRRTILRKYLSNYQFDIRYEGKRYGIQPFALIIDNVFNNEELEKKQNITLIEEIVAACAYKNYIFVDTMSTTLELGLFPNSYSQNKTTALLPKDYELFRPSVGYFVTETIKKSNNISLCVYRNRRVNKVVKKQGQKTVIENLVAFQTSKVPVEIEKEIKKDFSADIEKFTIRIEFTETLEEGKIPFRVSEEGVKLIVLPRILFYFVEKFGTKAKIINELCSYFGKYVCESRPDLVGEYYRITKGELKLTLESVFQYSIDDVINNMSYLIDAIGVRNNGIQQSYTRLKYVPVKESWSYGIQHISQLFGFGNKEYKEVIRLCKNISKAVTSKRLVLNGKSRNITMYACNFEGYELRNVHVKFVKRLQKLILLQPYSYAYKENCSTLQCVEQHIDNKYFLKLDIKDFFNSISKREMNKILKCHLCDNGMDAYKDNVINKKSTYRSAIIRSWNGIEYILNFCFVNGKLPLGLVSSPFFSNIYMDFFDKRFHEKFPELTYTRYSDDMLVSSSTKINSKDVLDFVAEELSYLHLKINRKKLREHYLENNGDHMKFLGLNIVLGEDGTKFITVGKKYIHMVCKNISDYENGINAIDKGQMLGQIEYVKSVSIRDFGKLSELYLLKNGRTLDLKRIRDTFVLHL